MARAMAPSDGHAAKSPSAPLQPPGAMIAGRYRVIDTLGRGGQGIVYKAFDVTLQRPVALKLLTVDPSRHDAVRQSVSDPSLSHLHHPNILSVYEHGEADGHRYEVTQFVEGRTLDQILRRYQRLPPDAAIEIAVRVGTALTFSHWHGVVHGDVKPGNIMVSTDGNVLLADFNPAARSPDVNRITSQTVFGTPAYMSPEHAMGEIVDARSDVFSLGAVLYETLTGRKWFAVDGDSLPAAELIRRVVEADPPPVQNLVPELPQAVAVVVHKALAKDRNERYQSAADFVNALLPIEATPLALLLDEPPVAAPLASRGMPSSSRRDRSTAVGDDTDTANVPAYLPQSKERVLEFASLWDALVVAAHESKERFLLLTDTLARGLLREAVGYQVGDHIPHLKGTTGYMVEAFWWIRQTRFPLLFVAFDQQHSDLLATVVNQLAAARAAEFFALLVVVPTRGTLSGQEALEVRRIVANSIYRLDFVVLDRERLESIIAHNTADRLIDIILEQIEDPSVLSPYVVRGPVPGRMFFGREQEIKTIAQILRRGDCAIVGGRRIGKSSILLRLKRLLGDDPRYHAIYVDCEAHFRDEDFVAAVREHVDVPAGGEPWSFRAMATRIRDAYRPRQVIFLLDEIDELLAIDAERRPPAQLFKTLRAASQDGVCRFAFSGSRTLHAHLRDSQSPFFNFCDAISLGRLSEPSVHEIVQHPMHQLGMQMPDEPRLIARLIALTSSHPNLAQWLCDKLVRSSVARRVTLDRLESIAATEEFHEQYVSTAWGDATALEKLITLVVDGPHFHSLDVQRALAAHGVTNIDAIRRAIDYLQLVSLFDRTANGYSFGLAQFPRIARESGLVPAQIEPLAIEARRSCS
jgi:hypothetical protein